MAGDVGFDPLGLSSIAGLAGADLYWMREAELKHCRVAMMAVAGVLWCETIGSLPGFPSGSNQMKLFWEVWAEKPQYVAAGFIMAGIIESEPSLSGSGVCTVDLPVRCLGCCLTLSAPPRRESGVAVARHADMSFLVSCFARIERPPAAGHTWLQRFIYSFFWRSGAVRFPARVFFFSGRNGEREGPGKGLFCWQAPRSCVLR